MEDCAFELSYIKNEHDYSNDHLIADTRIKHGELLGRTHPVNADYVVPIPETAIHYALGYSISTKVQLCHAVFKNRPKIKTLFIGNRKNVINSVFTVIPRFIKNKKIILVDETVISGLSLSQILLMVKSCMPKEIHIRLACPPMKRKCPSNDWGKDWVYDGYKVFDDPMITSVESLSIEQISESAKCSFCFGGKDDKSKMVRYKV